MLRPAFHRLITSRAIPTLRTFATTPRILAVGDTGSGFSRPQGERAGDAWTRREQASEEMWIRNEERNRLLALKERMARREEHMDELERHLDDAMAAEGVSEEERGKLKELREKHGKARAMAKELERHVDDIIEAAEKAEKVKSAGQG